MPRRSDLLHTKKRWNNWSWKFDSHLTLKNLAFNALLKNGVPSRILYEHLPKATFHRHGFILETHQNLYRVASYRTSYDQIDHETLIRTTSPIVESRLKRNLLRNVFGLTDLMLRKKDFIIKFSRSYPPPISSTFTTSPTCGCQGKHHENIFSGEHFLASIKSRTNFSTDNRLKRIIDFPWILSPEVKKKLKADKKKITTLILRTLGERCVRIQFCIKIVSTWYSHHFDFKIVLQKTHESDKINIEERTSKNLGIINLLSTLELCARCVISD